MASINGSLSGVLSLLDKKGKSLLICPQLPQGSFKIKLTSFFFIESKSTMLSSQSRKETLVLEVKRIPSLISALRWGGPM